MLVYFEYLIILAVVMMVCAIGFKKYVWFISIGYGFSISAVGAALLIIYRNQLDLLKIIVCILFIVYGLRLGGFLALREIKSSSYNAKMKTEISDGSHMTLPIKILLWITCALLYVMMTSPVIYRFANRQKSDICFLIGIIIIFCGILIEAISDLQKSAAKKINPHRFCDRGLFRIVRYPNYLGELILWTGVFVSGITAIATAGQWITAAIGYLGIIYVMFSGARRLELRQDRTYGNDPEYQQYAKITPIMIPLVPLYSVKKHKWLVG